ncbi:MAG: CCA tRNA nucleotidyltransferase, partial [Pseudarthrobacter sp.]
RNQRKAERLAFAYDDLEARIAALREQESLDAVRPDLDGARIMALLGIKPGPVVGRAYKFLLNERMENGPLPAEEAEARLLRWWAGQPESAAAVPPSPAPDAGTSPAVVEPSPSEESK